MSKPWWNAYLNDEQLGGHSEPSQAVTPTDRPELSLDDLMDDLIGASQESEPHTEKKIRAEIEARFASLSSQLEKASAALCDYSLLKELYAESERSLERLKADSEAEILAYDLALGRGLTDEERNEGRALVRRQSDTGAQP